MAPQARPAAPGPPASPLPPPLSGRPRRPPPGAAPPPSAAALGPAGAAFPRPRPRRAGEAPARARGPSGGGERPPAGRGGAPHAWAGGGERGPGGRRRCRAGAGVRQRPLAPAPPAHTRRVPALPGERAGSASHLGAASGCCPAKAAGAREFSGADPLVRPGAIALYVQRKLWSRPVALARN